MLSATQAVVHDEWTLASCDWCDRKHKSWHTAAKCRWRKGLIWCAGNPPRSGPCFALVSFCRAGRPVFRGETTTVTLWPALEEAERAKAIIDASACGGACSRQHYIFAGESGL